jgi:hypothetical protein
VEAPALSSSGCEPLVTERSFVSSEEPFAASGDCEPSVPDGFFVSSITQFLTKSAFFHGWKAGPLSHAEPRRKSGVRVSLGPKRFGFGLAESPTFDRHY